MVLIQVEPKRGFCAGVVIENGVVVQSAPVIHYMKGWEHRHVIQFCLNRKWRYTIVEHDRIPSSASGKLKKRK